MIKLYRRLLPVRPDGHLTDQDILTRVGLPSPIELLGRARLRYVATILHCGVQTEWGLLNGGRPTMDWACGGNMEWAWKQLLQHSSHLLEPRQNWEQWHNLTVFHRSYWRRLVRRACEHACSAATFAISWSFIRQRYTRFESSTIRLHPAPAS